MRGLFPHVLLYIRACQTQFTNGAEVSPQANKVRARPIVSFTSSPCMEGLLGLFNGTFSERPEFKLAPFEFFKPDNYTDLCLTLCHMN